MCRKYKNEIKNEICGLNIMSEIKGNSKIINGNESR